MNLDLGTAVGGEDQWGALKRRVALAESPADLDAQDVLDLVATVESLYWKVSVLAPAVAAAQFPFPPSGTL